MADGNGVSRPPAPDAKELARLCAAAASDKKGTEIVVLNVAALIGITDYFVIATGMNSRHLRAMADAMKDQLAKVGAKKIGQEGYGEGSWILIDFGDVVAHLFLRETRGFYDLESLWGDAEKESFK